MEAVATDLEMIRAHQPDVVVHDGRMSANLAIQGIADRRPGTRAAAVPGGLLLHPVYTFPDRPGTRSSSRAWALPRLVDEFDGDGVGSEQPG